LCSREFVSARDSILPESNRRLIYEREFMKSKDTHNYWDNAFYSVLAYLESHKGLLMINRVLRNSFDNIITSQKNLDAFVFIVVREAYNIVMAR